MPRKQDPRAAEQLLALLRALPWPARIAVVVLLLVAAFAAYWWGTPPSEQSPPTPPGANRGLEDPPPLTTVPPSPTLLNRTEFLFCWWNVENFFDDKNDGWGSIDEPYDEWFAANPDMVALKIERLATVLRKLNGGLGPDILAVCEVEDSRGDVTPRALELLRARLNQGLDPGLQYRHQIWKHIPGGRAILPAILTRLPVDESRTAAPFRGQSVLQGVIQVRGHDLVVLACHWTSRVTDKTGATRARYGDNLYDYYRRLQADNPNVPVLIAGDFNDEPTDPSITDHLHAVADPAAVRAARGTLLLDLVGGPHLAGLGTIDSDTRLAFFDHIVASPGLLNGGRSWAAEPGSVGVVTEGTTRKLRGSGRLVPVRFGAEGHKGERGYSDHLPVFVTLRLPR